MATNAINEVTEKKFLVTLFLNNECAPKDKKYIKMGIKDDNLSSLAASTIFEKALIYHSKGKLISISENYRDFNDNSDAKMYTAQLKGKTVKASIDCTGKLGAIRLWVKESITNKDYYFYIPRHAYSKHITIPFDINGSPKLKNKFWSYRVNSLEELSNKM